MNSSLYHISEKYLAIIREVEEADGELNPELEEALIINEANLAEACINQFGVLKVFEGNTVLIDKEIERLQDLRERNQNYFNRIKGNLLQATLIFGEENSKSKVKTLNFGTFKFSTRRNPKVEIIDEKVVDIKYCDFSVTLKKLTKSEKEKAIRLLKDFEFKPEDKCTISKTRIKEDNIAGIDTDGAYYNKENFSLTIK